MNPPHPELTAEYAALYNFPDLFTEEELAVARGRLESQHRRAGLQSPGGGVAH